MKRQLTSALIMIATLSSGCGSDKDATEFNLKKLNDEVSKAQAVGGTYSGKAYLVSSAEPLGDLTVQLTVDTKAGPSIDGVTPGRIAVVQGNISLMQSTQSFLSFPDGLFNSQANDVDASIPVTRQDGSMATVHFKGHFQNDTLVGSLEVPGLPESHTSFTLTRSNPTSTVKPSTTSSPSGIPSENYISTGSNFGSVRLSLQQEQNSLDQIFLDSITPIQLVDVILTMDGGLPQAFYNSQYDLRTNSILSSTSRSVSGSSSSSSSTNKPDLNCSYVMLSATEKGLSCRYRTSKIDWTSLTFKRLP